LPEDSSDRGVLSDWPSVRETYEALSAVTYLWGIERLKYGIEIGSPTGPGDLILELASKSIEYEHELPFLAVGPRAFGSNAELGEAVFEFNEGVFATMLENLTLSRLAGNLASWGSILGWADTLSQISLIELNATRSLYLTSHQENWCVIYTGGCGFYGKALQAQRENDAAAYEKHLAAGAGMTREQVLGLAGEGSGPLVSHPAEVRTPPPSAPSGTRSGSSAGSSGGRAAGPPGAGGNPGEGRNQEPYPTGPAPGPDGGGGDCGILCAILSLF